MKNFWQKIFFKANNDSSGQLRLPGLEHKDVAIIEKYIQQRTFVFEELIYERGTPSAALYYINSGSVGLFTLVGENQEERTQYISKGRWFGISALLENELRPYTARALEETELLTVIKSDVDALLASDPYVGTRFLLTLIAELHAAHVEVGEEYSRLLSKLTQSNIIV